MSENFEASEQLSQTPEPLPLNEGDQGVETPSESTGSEPLGDSDGGRAGGPPVMNEAGLEQDESEGNGFEDLSPEDQARLAQTQGLQHLKVIASVLERALFLGIDADNVAFAKGYVNSMIQVASQKVEGKENSGVEAQPFRGLNPSVRPLTRSDVDAVGRAAKRRAERAARRSKRG